MTFNPFKWFQTVDSILSDFQSKVDDLEELSDLLEERAEDQRIMAADLMARASHNEKDAKRATRIAGKIQEFLV